MIITDEQVNTLKPYIPNIEELVKGDDVQDLLDAIDDVIIENILDNGDEPGDEGIRLQNLWDKIFNQN